MNRMAIFILIALTFLTFSCRRGDKTKVVIEKSMAERIELPEKLKVTIDLRNIRNAIVAYETNHQQFPALLDELSIDLNYPGEYEYDAQSGVVTSKNYPDL
jgi:hypothetical protein